MDWKTIFMLFGGLALFIFSMNFMSDGLQKAAGEKMRSILEVLTGNPIMGALAGLLVTALIQSSSATTVIVIGLISAELMTLPQAISVVFGANIGTTITAQLVAFKISDYAWLFVAVGFLLFFIIKNKQVKYIGQVILAFGMLFVGLDKMSEAMIPLGNSDLFRNWITAVADVPILGVFVGTGMTLILQSSSATIAILQQLASTATDSGGTLLSLQQALPILFGDNIGTTITAILASIGGGITAKRVAAAHSTFNIAGTVVFMFFVPWFAKLVALIPPNDISHQIANAHTIFNLLNMLLWLPFIWLMVKIVKMIIPGKESSTPKRVVYLDDKLIRQPVIAMNLATKELTRMVDITREMMTYSKISLVNRDIKKAETVAELEDIVDMIERATVRYLSNILSENELTEKQSVRLAGLMHVVSDIERLGDHCKNISEFAIALTEKKIPFSETADKELRTAFDLMERMTMNSMKALNDGDVEIAQKVLEDEKEIDHLEKDIRKKHMKRLKKHECSPKATLLFVEIIHNLERMGDHCTNIAEAVLQDNNIAIVENDNAEMQ